MHIKNRGDLETVIDKPPFILDWRPSCMAFGEDGGLYVWDSLNQTFFFYEPGSFQNTNLCHFKGHEVVCMIASASNSSVLFMDTTKEQIYCIKNQQGGFPVIEPHAKILVDNILDCFAYDHHTKGLAFAHKNGGVVIQRDSQMYHLFSRSVAKEISFLKSEMVIVSTDNGMEILGGSKIQTKIKTTPQGLFHLRGEYVSLYKQYPNNQLMLYCHEKLKLDFIPDRMGLFSFTKNGHQKELLAFINQTKKQIHIHCIVLV